MKTVNEVREDLLALARAGDALRGGDWAAIEAWHVGVVAYVRAALGYDPADDIASRLRLTRGATLAEKQAHAIGFVNDWLGTQSLALTSARIMPGFDGIPPETATLPEPEVLPPLVEATDVAADDDLEFATATVETDIPDVPQKGKAKK